MRWPKAANCQVQDGFTAEPPVPSQEDALWCRMQKALEGIHWRRARDREEAVDSWYSLFAKCGCQLGQAVKKVPHCCPVAHQDSSMQQSLTTSSLRIA
eukprot:CAMPEP_0114620368 /NCGR_PEP_ID=MMETSP0168-20121206/8689_1 /TAXON_ID=95228 ORGANISM="Vannella sp., Strain DIVA3 517/6/12" /NCGR_SAMPLE_ID=MMETSP0168 /ASSEMBLY_ACC=CAM_ASM_000044 /LENGTH=97 /DNA_ID=CAMNT_0001831557 /DNA_START=121 /DNA_END=414 /DNA_ORIENTATION=-